MKPKTILIGLFNFALAMTLFAFAGVGIEVAVPVATLIAVGAEFAMQSPIGRLHTGFITNGSEYNGKENTDIMMRPVFTGPDVTMLGFRTIFTDGSGSVKVTFFGQLSKILRRYSTGFQGLAGLAGKLQKKFALAEFKAEAAYDKHDYANTIMELITNRGGINQNDIDGTKVMEAERAYFFAAVKADILRYFWLGDTAKKYVLNGVRYDSSADVVITVDNNTGAATYVSGGADIFYNVIDGVWKSLMADASTTPTYNQVKKVAVSNGTVAQVSTVTLTGTSGTANITINGVAYLATFATDLTTTATNFDTLHSAALTALGITVTTSTVDVIFTSAVAGQPFTAPTITNLTGNLNGSNVQTTANTPAQALGADEAYGYMKDMIKQAPKVLKAMIGTNATSMEGTDKGVIEMPQLALRFYCTDTWIENYLETLENDGTEAARLVTIDGIERTTFRGIPLIPMGVDGFLEADFISPYPHRCLLTTPENLCLVLNGQGEFAETKFWMNPDENENRQRTQFEFGANYVLPELVVVAF